MPFYASNMRDSLHQLRRLVLLRPCGLQKLLNWKVLVTQRPEAAENPLRRSYCLHDKFQWYLIHDTARTRWDETA